MSKCPESLWWKLALWFVWMYHEYLGARSTKLTVSLPVLRSDRLHDLWGLTVLFIFKLILRCYDGGTAPLMKVICKSPKSWHEQNRHSRHEYFMFMMTSSNGNVIRVTSPLCGKFTVTGEFPAQRPVTQSFDVFFDLSLIKRLGKQPWGRWFETPSRSLWRHFNAILFEYMSSPFSCLCMLMLTSNSSGNMQKHGYLGCFHAVSTSENIPWVWVIGKNIGHSITGNLLDLNMLITLFTHYSCNEWIAVADKASIVNVEPKAIINKYVLEFFIVTSWWARWRLKSRVSRLFAQPFVQAQIK